MYIFVQCTLYTVHCTVYSVYKNIHCVYVHDVGYKTWSVHCTLYTNNAGNAGYAICVYAIIHNPNSGLPRHDIGLIHYYITHYANRRLNPGPPSTTIRVHDMAFTYDVHCAPYNVRRIYMCVCYITPANLDV